MGEWRGKKEDKTEEGSRKDEKQKKKVGEESNENRKLEMRDGRPAEKEKKQSVLPSS